MFPFRIYYCACLRWIFCHHNTPYVICHTCHRLSPLIRGLPSPKHKDVWELRPASHTRLRAHDHCTSSTLIGGKGWAGPSSLHTTLEGPTECVCVCARVLDGCTVYMDSYMAPNGSCFMVTWTIFKTHLLEVGLTQN